MQNIQYSDLLIMIIDYLFGFHCRYRAQGYTMDLKNYDSQTALHIAVRENQEEIVEFLLQECNQKDLGQTQKDR